MLSAQVFITSDIDSMSDKRATVLSSERKLRHTKLSGRPTEVARDMGAGGIPTTL